MGQLIKQKVATAVHIAPMPDSRVPNSNVNFAAFLDKMQKNGLVSYYQWRGRGLSWRRRFLRIDVRLQLWPLAQKRTRFILSADSWRWT
jgi:hypothetical protein